MKLLISIALSIFLAVPIWAQKSLSFTSVSRIDVTGRNFAVLLDNPEAIYEGARIEHDVTVNKEMGMLVHAKFRVNRGLNIPCMLIAYFYYDDANQTPLKTEDTNYRDAKGNVSAHVNFTPAYDHAVYNDLQLFMPYSSFNMERGKEFRLKFYLALYDKESGRFFGRSGWYKFTLTMP
jgi:hypothetical protein